MSTRPSQRAAGPNPTHGSMTVTAHEAGPSTAFNLPARTLRLRAEPTETRHIQWAEDVVDNEGMGKKSSKVCCIYHKPREAGESSSEDDSSSSDSSDAEPDTSRAQPAKRRTASSRRHHNDGEPCDHDHDSGTTHRPPRRTPNQRTSSPNAYERVPKRKSPKGKGKEPEG